MIYLIILAIVFTFILRLNWHEKKENRGIVASLYLISYSVLRFFNEYLRDDSRGGFYTAYNLSPAQVTSIVLAICGILFIIIRKRKAMKEVDCEG